jgi:hypothetical protein
MFNQIYIQVLLIKPIQNNYMQIHLMGRVCLQMILKSKHLIPRQQI